MGCGWKNVPPCEGRCAGRSTPRCGSSCATRESARCPPSPSPPPAPSAARRPPTLAAAPARRQGGTGSKREGRAVVGKAARANHMMCARGSSAPASRQVAGPIIDRQGCSRSREMQHGRRRSSRGRVELASPLRTAFLYSANRVVAICCCCPMASVLLMMLDLAVLAVPDGCGLCPNRA